MSNDELLKVIIKYFEEEGFYPSIKELIELTPIKSKATIHRKLHQLEKENKIQFKCKHSLYRVIP